MKKLFQSTLLTLGITIFALPAEAQQICSIIANAKSSKILHQEGNCDQRVTPASTFKVPLALIGFDSGILTSAIEPTWPYKKSYPAWGGANWKKPTDPTHWLHYSVVWYSQVMAQKLGEAELSAYAQKFGYGNADFSGDPGKNNGLERAWIASSLKVSPNEQRIFLEKLIRKELQIVDHAYAELRRALPHTKIGKWDIFAKTGMAYPRLKNGQLDRAHPYGWFVGWAEYADERYVFVQLQQDPKKLNGSASHRARDTIMQKLKQFLPQ